MIIFDKRILNFAVIVTLTFISFWWTFFIFNMSFNIELIATILALRIISSLSIYKDYSLSWSKATQKTFLLKTIVVVIPLFISFVIFYKDIKIYFLLSEAITYLFALNLSLYTYYFYVNRSQISKSKSLVIYGAGKAGNKLEEEFKDTKYKMKYFVDDDKIMQSRSIDSIQIISKLQLKNIIGENNKFDLLVIAIPSASKERIKEIHKHLNPYFKKIKILPSLQEILKDREFSIQLRDISIEDLLARHPANLDKSTISSFIKNKKVLITGAGGSIGSEIAKQCVSFEASELILLDHSEFNLYNIAEELSSFKLKLVMQSIVNKKLLDITFQKHMPDIVIHAAAYKHVPLVEENINETIINNIIGTKNMIDFSIKYGVEKFVLISTDKAVRPTNVMGATKRICELYAQNSNGKRTDIVAVRFGNVLGSSGSVIPKFKSQIEAGKNITVTHPDITRYFMLIQEACELVLQAGAIGTGGEIFILDMGKPIKIVDLATKMIELSGRGNIEIEFSGLRPGEKLYEELLIDDSECTTGYNLITVAKPTKYDITMLNKDIEKLVNSDDKIKGLKEIVPEFNHQLN